MIYTNRADLLEAAAKSIRMQEAEKVEPVCKFDGSITYIQYTTFAESPELYEFPLAIVEGKPVWVGSELYCSDGRKIVMGHTLGSYSLVFPDDISWNPPTHKPEIQEGFTPWNGGERPVDLGDDVEVIFKTGVRFLSRAVRLSWWLKDTPDSIIAYRVINDTIKVSRDKLKTIADLVNQLGEALKD